MFYPVVAILLMASMTTANPGGYGGGGGHGGGGHGGGGGYGGGGGHGGGGYGSAILPYSFGYSVKGDYKGPSFGHNEKSNGKAVSGSYTVALPDGRRQHVSYSAGGYNGFVAKVTYSGKAQHPSYYGKAVTFAQNGGGGYH